MLMSGRTALSLAGLAVDVLLKPSGKLFAKPKRAADSMLKVKLDVLRMSSGKPLSGAARTENRLGAAEGQPDRIKTVELTEEDEVIVVYTDGTRVQY